MAGRAPSWTDPTFPPGLRSLSCAASVLLARGSSGEQPLLALALLFWLNPNLVGVWITWSFGDNPWVALGHWRYTPGIARRGEDRETSGGASVRGGSSLCVPVPNPSADHA